MAEARGDGALDETFGAAAGGLDQGAARFRADGKPVEALGAGDDGALAIEHGHMGVGIIEARQHGSCCFFQALPTGGDGCAEQDGLVTGTDGHGLDGRGDGHAAKAAADAHDEAAAFAGRLHLLGGYGKLAEGDIGAIRAGIEEVVDVFLAEKCCSPAIRPQNPAHIL